MTYETRFLVRRVAENYLMSLKKTITNVDNFPIDVEGVIKHLNGSIYEYKDNTYSDGYIRYLNASNPPSFEIHLKKISNQQRRRFTLAHELGHLILHMDFFEEKLRQKHGENYYRTAGDYAEKELQANEFAASFLMPSKFFIQIASENLDKDENKYNVDAMAEYFNVSRLAIITRGQWLGLFKW